MPDFNQAVFGKLKDAPVGDSIQAVLLYFDVKGSSLMPAWEFLVNPGKMKYSNKPDYGAITTLGSSVKEQQYNGTSGGTLELPDILFNTWVHGKSLRSLTDGLKELIKANPDAAVKKKKPPPAATAPGGSPATRATPATATARTPTANAAPAPTASTGEGGILRNAFSPPVLSFQFGTFRFEPCIITAISWDIEALLGGDEARIRLNLSLTEIPRPKTQAELEQEARDRLEYVMEQNSNQVRPRTPLTDRQIQEGKKAAEKYLDQHWDVFTPELAKIIKTLAYEFRVDKDTGDISMIDPKTKKVLGVVCRWDGTKGIAATGITTIPLKSPTTRIPDFNPPTPATGTTPVAAIPPVTPPA